MMEESTIVLCLFSPFVVLLLILTCILLKAKGFCPGGVPNELYTAPIQATYNDNPILVPSAPPRQGNSTYDIAVVPIAEESGNFSTKTFNVQSASSNFSEVMIDPPSYEMAMQQNSRSLEWSDKLC